MSTESPLTSLPHASNDGVSPPRRYIFTEIDMVAFKASPAKKELLRLVSAMGRSCSCYNDFTYDPSAPIKGLSPAMASLHGSLRQMESWLQEIPPDEKGKARFGNPSFRQWHSRLKSRSRTIVKSVLKCCKRHAREQEYSNSILNECAKEGYQAASIEEDDDTDKLAPNDENVLLELRTYLHDAFGHPTRLDYGTGHESSFMVFLFSLCKIGCFGNESEKEPPTATRLKATTLSIFSQYLLVTRGLQTDYMLEPAGSHGVWGLDDYHCLPFYFGACQLMVEDDYTPQSIHDYSLLLQHSEEFMYFGCIKYIKELKKGVPFFESSPILNDISDLPTWQKVAAGLLRLYEGEVLDKRQVVQHFVFGNIFKGIVPHVLESLDFAGYPTPSNLCMCVCDRDFIATWTPSEQPRTAPQQTFVNGPGGAECIAPWTAAAGNEQSDHGPPPSTRAPWAK